MSKRKCIETSASTAVEIKPVQEVYLGIEKYYITNFSSQMTILTKYMTYVLGLMVGGYQGYSSEDIYRQIPQLISSGFFGILKFNNILIKEPIKLLVSLQSINLDFCYYDPDGNRLFIDQTNIEQFLRSNLPSVNITFDDSVEKCDFDYTTQVGKQVPEKFSMFKLFVIADHLATHYIEIYKSGTTDWYGHKDFGEIPAITLHSLFKIIGTSGYKNIFDTNKDIAQIKIRSRDSNIFDKFINSINGLPDMCGPLFNN